MKSQAILQIHQTVILIDLSNHKNTYTRTLSPGIDSECKLLIDWLWCRKDCQNKRSRDMDITTTKVLNEKRNARKVDEESIAYFRIHSLCANCRCVGVCACPFSAKQLCVGSRYYAWKVRKKHMVKVWNKPKHTMSYVLIINSVCFSITTSQSSQKINRR